jgi:hypothetical protein
MENQANNEGLLAAYRIAGFRTRARIDSYEGKHKAFVITLDRRQKKRCAASAARRITVFMIGGGTGRAIWIAAAAPFIWTSSIAAWPAKGALA